MASIAASEEGNVENDGANGSGGDNSSLCRRSCAESVGVATIVEEIPQKT